MRFTESSNQFYLGLTVRSGTCTRCEISSSKFSCINMDETGLFWKAIPDYSLTTERIAGGKKDKARMLAIVACNQDGSDKLPL
ncbi:MAG: hypothetical protein FE78DRAFT_486634 [Acidomyces sp. 'richmondensis']|nr:MAG: hypothetical protein FE78DRAFT_486634 [Acidomyces sp. 'richmondensis']